MRCKMRLMSRKRLLEEKDREIARLKEQLERIKHPV